MFFNMSMFYVSHISEIVGDMLILRNYVCLSEFNFSRTVCLYFI